MLRKTLIAALSAVFLLLPTALATAAPTEGMRGIWVPSVLNLDYPSAQGLSADELRAEADTILDRCADMGLNAVFLQVRPSADSLYDSDVFPWSRYLTGTQGVAPPDGFDPLDYWVTEAHARGLQLHAWLNPYRITKSGDTEWKALSADHPARQNPSWVIRYEENYYFDPALPEVQQLVVDGAKEIVRNYDVDGIHLDDYFYPGTDFADDASYALYGGGRSRDDWRRDNVNTLVAALDHDLHVLDPDLSFGISPAGIWDNASANPAGSDTAGRASRTEIYCDTLAWIQAGTVDYVCPQLYWSIGYEIADFSILTQWWQNAVLGSDVDLYIGIGAYRMEDAKPGDTFYGTDEIGRQLSLLQSQPDVGGMVFYRYNSFDANARSFLKNHYAQPITQPQATQTPEAQAASLSEVFSRFVMALFR